MNLTKNRADRLTALVLLALGLAMAIGGFTMDRLEVRQIHPASIPGLLPIFLGGAMMVCAVALFLKAGGKGLEEPRAGGAGNGRDLAFAAGYSLVYALLLVGRMPFAAATAIYIAVFVLHFTFDPGRSRSGRALAIAGALGFAVISATAISVLFRYGFLVRLP